MHRARDDDERLASSGPGINDLWNHTHAAPREASVSGLRPVFRLPQQTATESGASNADYSLRPKPLIKKATEVVIDVTLWPQTRPAAISYHQNLPCMPMARSWLDDHCALATSSRSAKSQKPPLGRSVKRGRLKPLSTLPARD